MKQHFGSSILPVQLRIVEFITVLCNPPSVQDLFPAIAMRIVYLEVCHMFLDSEPLNRS